MFRTVLFPVGRCQSTLGLSSKSIFRAFTTTSTIKMPDSLTKEEVQKHQDPSVMKQWDDQTDAETKFKDFYKIADGLKVDTGHQRTY